eukprot:TRINITY_DN53887_c0_g2_i1.p1 TRINITY_DN53887_c0_g2~~TRINITY_DN53887_c0_g2_i1.p1  ORF type:complete len:629 (-),score=96.50 TRINITY_DN53887_c0_g2_i1:220-2034(-)
MVPRILKEANAGKAAGGESEDVRNLGQAGDGSVVHALSREILVLHEQLLLEHERALRCSSLAAAGGGPAEAAKADVMPLYLSDFEKKLSDGSQLVERSGTCSDSMVHIVSDMMNPTMKKSRTKMFVELEEQARDDARTLAAQVKSNASVARGSGKRPSIVELEHRLARGIKLSWLEVKTKLRTITEWPAFEAFFACAILANSIAVGVEVNAVLLEPHGGVSLSFAAMNYTFSLLFFLELMCRVGAHGTAFFCGSQWSWNNFDLVIVLSSLVEIVSDALGANTLGSGMGGRGARIIRILRITRFIRILRVARLMRFVRALRQLLLSIICTLQEVVWAFVLLLLVIYIFAITFAQVVSGQALETGQAPDGRLQLYWGSVPKSMWALFLSISGGINWLEVVEPLEDVWPPLVLLFSFYVTFTVFAMLNVITGVFCESAIAAARTDADHVCQEHLLHKSTYMQNVKKLFDKIGQHGADAITYDDLEEFLQDDMATGFFAALDIDISDVWTLFKLLDENESRLINLEEFVAGCFRLKGMARSLDVALIGYEHKQFRRRAFQFMDATDAMLEMTLDRLGQLQNQANGGLCSVGTSRFQTARAAEHAVELS